MEKQIVSDAPGAELQKVVTEDDAVTAAIREVWGDDDPMPEVALNLDPAYERKLVWKLDTRLLSVLALLYLMNYLDKTNIAQARLGTLEKDLHLTSVQYNTTISCFYIGYLLMQLPSNLMLARIRPSIWLPSIVALWGVCSACCGAAQNFGGLFAARFCVGLAEAGFLAGALYLMSCFYTKREMGFRAALLFSAFLVGGAFGGLIASGIMKNMQGAGGLAAWRWLFIIEGSITVPIALLAILILPDMPMTTRWLSLEERKLAVFRMARQNRSTASAEAAYARYSEAPAARQVMQGLTDPHIWILILCQLSCNTAASWTNFLPSIVKTLGYNQTQTLLLTAPPYLYSAAGCILWALHSDKRGNRGWYIAIPMAIAIIGFAMVASSLQVGVRYTACFIMVTMELAYPIILSWVPSIVPGPPIKRSVAYAQTVAWSNASFIYSSYFYPLDQAPRYWQACVANAAFAVLCIASALFLMYKLRRINARLDQAEAEDLATEGTAFGTRTFAILDKYQLPPGYRYLS